LSFIPNDKAFKKLKKRFATSMTEFHPKTKSEHLAAMLAAAFNDEEKIGLYVVYCKKHPHEVIQRAFADAQNFPEERIKKSRVALFFYLLKRYAHEA
jgi:hypothetical protein